MNIMIFGAGQRGQEAMQVLQGEGHTVCGFIDNDESKWGKRVCGISVIGLDKYISDGHSEQIVLGSTYKYQVEMEKQLKEIGISNYEYFDRNKVYTKPRLISYCSKQEMEDVILYHLLKDEDDIFYIDVGSNDPFIGSVTKLLYDMKDAHGINIEPQPWLCELTERERPRDITVCTALGEKKGKMELFLQDGGSTLHKENVIVDNCNSIEVEITTLKEICDKYIPLNTEISFLKIDVEGHEKEVLLGADFEKYRPKIVVMESTIPRTENFKHKEWEDILISNGYKYIYTRGVNRYYLIRDMNFNYSKRIEELKDIEESYHILKVQTFVRM